MHVRKRDQFTAWRVAIGAILACLTISTGCGKSDNARAPVHGAVTLDGKPLETGSILFVPAPGVHGAVAGGAIQNGRYELTDKAEAAIGANRVEIRSARSTGKAIQYAPGTAVSREVIQLIPKRYNSESELKVEVKPGPNTADFAVTSK
jgi:hypothetical protein